MKMEAVIIDENEAELDDSVTLWGYVEAQALSLSLELYDLDNSRSGRLRVFIEKQNLDSLDSRDLNDTSSEQEDVIKETRGSKVTSDDCSKLIRKLIHGFAVHGSKLGVGSEPELEVSSPGVERVLRLQKHFEAAVGEKVKITARDGFNSGVLIGLKDNLITLRVGQNDVEILLDDIKKAQVEY